MARQIVVEVAGDASKFGRATQEATAHANKFNSVLAGFGAGIGLKIFDTLAEGVHMAMDKIRESGKIFREDQTSAVLLGQAMKDNIKNFSGSTDAAEKFVATQERLGIGALEARNSLGQLIGVTHNLAQAEKLQTLAMDFARAHHLDLATATDIVSKAAIGNAKALRAYGIVVPPITSHVDALTKGHHKYTTAQLAAAKSSDSAATKAAILKAIYDQTKGSAEAYANTSQGKLEAANAKNVASWVKIGSYVDKLSQIIMPALSNAFAKVTDAIDPTIAKVTAFTKTPLFGPVLAGVIAGLGALAIAIGVSLVAASIPAIAAGIATAIAWAPVTLLILGLAALAALLAYVWQNNFGDIQGKTHAVIDFIMPRFQALSDWFSKTAPPALNALKNVFGAVFSAIGTFVYNGLVSFANLINFVATAHIKINAAAAGMWNGIWAAFRAMLNTIVRAWNSLKLKTPDVNFLGQHVPSQSIGVPQIPYFHQGGIVPGPAGSNVLAMLQAGERVSRAGSRSGGDVHLHIGTLIGADGPGMDRLAREILQRARYAPGT